MNQKAKLRILSSLSTGDIISGGSLLNKCRPIARKDIFEALSFLVKENIVIKSERLSLKNKNKTIYCFSLNVSSSYVIEEHKKYSDFSSI